jgi:hypothetical protein
MVRLRAFLITAGLALAAGSAQAHTLGAHLPIGRTVESGRCTIYVSPHGRAHRGRSRFRPTSLGWALGHARAGSVVCLERGTYRTRNNIIVRRSGVPGRPIVIRGFHARPRLTYVGSQRHWGGVIETSACRPWCAAHDVVFEHLMLYGRDRMESGVVADLGSRDISIVDCVISHTGASGIALNGTDHTFVADNLIYHAGYGGGWSSGISLWYGELGGAGSAADAAPGFHNYIVGNVVSGSYDNSFHHSDGHGIILDGSGGWTPPALIADNLVYENGGGGIAVGRTSGSTWVVNNTGFANGLDPRVSSGYAGDFMAVSTTTTHFVNNLAYGRRHGRAFTYAIYQASVTFSRNLAYAGRTTGVPAAVLHNPLMYRYANPRLVRLPRVPRGPAPWARALPPWRLGRTFEPRHGSPALALGISPLHVSGITAALAAGLRALNLV